MVKSTEMADRPSQEEPQSGSIPFAKLPDGRIIMANWAESWHESGLGWEQSLTTDWTLTLEGKLFQIFNIDDGQWWTQFQRRNFINESRKSGKLPPLPVTLAADGRFLLKFTTYYAHHLGSALIETEFLLDIEKMEIGARRHWEIDIDR